MNLVPLRTTDDDGPDEESYAAVRVQPHDPHAEQGVIGAALLSDEVAERLSEIVTASDFYVPAHASIWSAILEVRRNGDVADPLTVFAHMQRAGTLAKAGGAPAIQAATEATPTAANGTYYARIVRERAGMRALIAAGTRIAQAGWAADGSDLNERAEQARATLDTALAATDASGALDMPPTAAQLLEETFDGIENPTKVTPTGLLDLDHLIGGLAPSRLYVIGARPGGGKSVLGLQLARMIALTGKHAHVASMEMPRTEVMTRLLSTVAQVPLDELTRRKPSESAWSALSKATGAITALPLHIDDNSQQTLTHVRARARTIARKHDLGVIVIDYLQLMRARDPRLPRHEQVGEIARGLKLLAREFNVPVVALSQVNRSPLARQDKRPGLGDLREGGIENDADTVVLLHTDEEEDPGAIELLVEKNRYGPRGKVTCSWQPHYSLIDNLRGGFA